VILLDVEVLVVPPVAAEFDLDVATRDRVPVSTEYSPKMAMV
jgi:hypothetical protein